MAIAPEIPFELLHGNVAGWENILRELSDLMSDDYLRYISEADYGYMADECYILLKSIIDNQDFPKEAPFILGECFELCRWLEPTNRDGHIIRAFSTAALLIMQRESSYESISDENETVIAFIDSIIFLNYARKSAQELIIWRLLQDYDFDLKFYQAENDLSIDEIELNPFFVYGFLLLLIWNKEKVEDIARVADWNIEIAKSNPYFETSHFNLFDDNTFSQRKHLWEDLSQSIAIQAKSIENTLVREKLEWIFGKNFHR